MNSTVGSGLVSAAPITSTVSRLHGYVARRQNLQALNSFRIADKTGVANGVAKRYRLRAKLSTKTSMNPSNCGSTYPSKLMVEFPICCIMQASSHPSAIQFELG